MEVTEQHIERISKLTLASVYPHYLLKVQKKGRTQDELNTVIEWLTGYNTEEIELAIEQKLTFPEFFDGATLHLNSNLITGMICGYRIEEIEHPLTRKVRYLDKLVDELAKGKKMEKILRG